MSGQEKLPNGHKADFEIIKHPGAVLVVPFITKNKIVMLRQLRPVIDSWIYELPAGTLDNKESLINCAGREIVEETGYKAGKMKKLGKIFPVPGYSTEKITIFKAERLKKTRKLSQDDEIIRVFTFTKDRVRRLFKNGKIVDAKTICALAWCGWL